MLCSACEKFRFPYLNSKPAATEATKAEPSCDSDTAKRQIILNDVLCFINNKFHNHPATILKSTIMEFYREDELINAKQVLFKCVSDKTLSASLQPYTKTRIGTNKLKSITDDIMHMWTTIDEQDASASMLSFCSGDISRIATVPDELTDLAYLRTVVDDLRKQVRDLTGLVMQLSSQREKSCCCRDVLSRNDFMSAAGFQTPRPEIAVASSGGEDSGSSGNNSSDEQMSHTSQKTTTSSQQPTAYSDAANVIPPAAPAIETTDDGFQPVPSKKKKRQVVVGRSGSDTQFQGVAKKYVFCLNRVKFGTSVDTVSDFMKSRGISVFSCYIVNKKSDTQDHASDEQPPPRFISMRVCISQFDVKKIYDPDLWPAGITVRPWSFRQRSLQ